MRSHRLLLQPDQLLLKRKIDLGGGCEDNTIPQTAPAALSMINGADWEMIRSALEGYRQSNGFYNCPLVELAFVCTCCCACACLPCFLYLGQYDCRRKRLEDETIPEINNKLVQYGIRCEFHENDEHGMGQFILFYWL